MDQTVPEQWGQEYTWGHRTEAAKMTPKEILIFISVIKPGIRACGSWDEQPGDALPKANVVHRGAAINDKGATIAPPCTWRGGDRYPGNQCASESFISRAELSVSAAKIGHGGLLVVFRGGKR